MQGCLFPEKRQRLTHPVATPPVATCCTDLRKAVQGSDCVVLDQEGTTSRFKQLDVTLYILQQFRNGLFAPYDCIDMYVSIKDIALSLSSRIQIWVFLT